MIVNRINEYLSTEGKAVDESILKEVSDLAAYSFGRQFGVREERKERAPYFSSIGKCLRQQAYGLLGIERNGKEVDSRSKNVFFQGDMVEVAIIQVAKQAGCNISSSGSGQASIEIAGMRGRPDGILSHEGKDYVVEVKSMSSYSFKDFERGIVDESYRYQCNAAMFALSIGQTVFVAMNKDSGVLHEMVISADEAIIKDIQDRLDTLKAATKDDLPYRPYGPDEKGFYPWQCRYCAWFKTCLPKTELVLVKNSYKLREVQP